ncbi:hypothetical protein BGZ54_003563 [Gamsiella multidivaricata]|nr:hypothetical protein BGZ54_003563 [Gamsiella multidivaricata]
MATEQHTRLPLPLAVTIPAVLPPATSTNPAPLGSTTTNNLPFSAPAPAPVTEEDFEVNSAAAATKATTKPKSKPETAIPAAPALRPTTTDKDLTLQTQTQTNNNTTAATSRLHNELTVGSRKTEELLWRKQKQQLEQRTKEKTIEHVLNQGKILKVSRRLRTRLEYAILKIRRGWTKYTLQEVESLIQPVCSPRITARQIHQTISRQSSPHLSDRRRVAQPTYSVYDNNNDSRSEEDEDEATPATRTPQSYQRSSSHPATSMDIDREYDNIQISYHPSAPSTPTGRFRSRMPSLSQYKDSELFEPAKSLMDIATSHYVFDTASPQQQQQYSSSGSVSAPHSPRTLTSASVSLSPDRSPVMAAAAAAAAAAQAPQASQAAYYPQPKALKQPYYANLYEPSSPSPLSTSLFPSMEESTMRSQSRSSSPTLKRAVRFAAAATNASSTSSAAEPEILSFDRIKEKISGLGGEYNSAAEQIYPESQPGHDNKKELSAPALVLTSSPYDRELSYMAGTYHGSRPSTPPPPTATQGLLSSPSYYSVPGPYGASSASITPTPMGSSHHHGMRTPPMSGGRDFDLSHYSLGTKRRRDHDMVPAGTTDLPTMFRYGGTSASNSPRSH